MSNTAAEQRPPLPPRRRGHIVLQVRRGNQHPNAKLTPDRVREIRRRYWHEGESQASISRSMDVSTSTVQSVISGKSWGHVR